MGVLKVWGGTDWRKVGCGGDSADTNAYPTGSNSGIVYNDGNDVWIYTNGLPGTTGIVAVDGFNFPLLSGSVTGHAIFTGSGSGLGLGVGHTIVTLRARTAGNVYIADITAEVATVQAYDTPTPPGRLRLRLPDGSWVREVCDDDEHYKIVDPVPVGTIDDFNRPDGPAGATKSPLKINLSGTWTSVACMETLRYAECGNVWVPRGDVDDPPYITSDVLTARSGTSSMLGSIWVGGSELSFTVDIDFGSTNSSHPVLLYVAGDERPEFAGEQVIIGLRTDMSYVNRSSGGVLSSGGTGGGVAFGAQYRIYVFVTAITGGWHVVVDASFWDGTSYGNLLTADVTSPAPIGWLSLGATVGDVTFEDLIRTA